MNESVDVLTKVAQILAGPLGTFFVITLVGFAIATKRLVPGWIYQQEVEDGKKCRDDVSTRVAKNEADLEQLRRDRMGPRNG